MSIEIDWASITAGDDGAALAETVRAFIHDRFQHIPLPKLIRSVQVHAFDFGTVPPDIEIQDVCDPLPDFYEGDDDEEDSGDDLPPLDEHALHQPASSPPASSPPESSAPASSAPASRPQLNTRARPASPLESPHPLGARTTTPGIPGGTANLASYFHLPLSAGLAGTAMPFAAYAGAHGWPAADQPLSALPPHGYDHHQRRTPASPAVSSAAAAEASVNDVQIVARLRYAGNIRLSLTADINLDYPMQSFVGIPLQLNVTGLTFDGVAIVAYIKRKAHFCFLAPDDAAALVGGEGGPDVPSGVPGGLFEEICVESEIGQRTEGRQVLKNVGKVEKFVLEQVRRIFETEFVYPSFWTFLV